MQASKAGIIMVDFTLLHYLGPNFKGVVINKQLLSLMEGLGIACSASLKHISLTFVLFNYAGLHACNPIQAHTLSSSKLA